MPQPSMMLLTKLKKGTRDKNGWFNRHKLPEGFDLPEK